MMFDPKKSREGVLMAPRLEVIMGGRSRDMDGDIAPSAAMVAEFDLTIAEYIDGVLTQLEALSQLLAIEGLSSALGIARQESRDLVRRLMAPS